MPLPGRVEQLEGSVAFIVNASRISLVDISNPGNIAVLGSYNFANTDILALQIAAGRGYVITSSGLNILDVRNPILPTLEQTIPLVPLGNIQVIDDRAYVVGIGSCAVGTLCFQVTIVDFSDPASPRVLSSYAGDRFTRLRANGPSSVAVADNLLFLISRSYFERTWDIVDVTNLNRPIRVGRYLSKSEPYDAQIVAGHMYLASTQGFQILQIDPMQCSCSEAYLPSISR
jgi:hypothetical protein